MAVKDLKYYEKQIRKKFPNYSEEQVKSAAKSAYESDPASTYKKPKQDSGVREKPKFGEDITEEDNLNGISIGFGTDGVFVPARVSSYVVSLLSKDPKAYANIKRSIETVTGRKYNDPNLVGAYVQRLAENIYTSQDPAAKMVSIEDYLRLASKYRTGTAEKVPVPTRQIYQKTEAERRDILNESAVKLIGRNFNEDDMQQTWYKNLKNALDEMIDKGTLTTTKKVKNPKTGKIENVVESKPFYSEEKISGMAQTAIQENLKDDVDRMRRNNFANWLVKEIGTNG